MVDALFLGSDSRVILVDGIAMLEVEGAEPVAWIDSWGEEFPWKEDLLLNVSLVCFGLPVRKADKELLLWTIDPKVAIPLAVKVLKLELPFGAFVVTTEVARCELFLAMAEVDTGVMLDSHGWVPGIGREVL